MAKVCNRCGAPDGQEVCYRLDGSNMFALDLDLAVEQPKTWGPPSLVRIKPSGVCKNCISAVILDTRLEIHQAVSQPQAVYRLKQEEQPES